MPDIPRAVQSLTSKGLVSRSVVCPEHKKRTSKWLYADSRGWAFTCGYNGHRFYAKPDLAAPTTQQEIAQWTQSQLNKRLQKQISKQQ